MRPAQIRIIAGRWRGSRLKVLNREGCRPTPDRVRETLFNWLAADIPGAEVLDCFAGAGGLGLEAASREASGVTLVELDQRNVQNLQSEVRRLQAQNVEVVHADVISFIQSSDQCYDLVFIDPPYAQPAMRQQVLDLLIASDRLKPGCKVYVEWPLGGDRALSHDNLTWVKQKAAAQVEYALAQWRVTG